MKFILSLLVTTVPIVGQVSSPAGYLNRGGTRPAYFIAGSDSRCFYLDGELGTQPQMLKDLSWRHGNVDYSSLDGMGRSWSRVTVRYAPCDADTTVSRFDQIPLAAPVQVFGGSLALPTITGRPNSSPATWGMRVPFSATIAYTGQADVGLEFEFAGGRLANGASIGAQLYAVDGYAARPHRDGFQISSTGGCADSASPALFGASSVRYTVHAAQHPDPTLRNRVVASIGSHHTAPGQAVVHGVSVGSLTPGFSVPGIACTPLFLDFLRPVVIAVARTNATGVSHIAPAPFAYQSTVSGLPLSVQSAWEDSTTGQLKLTRAMSLITPTQPDYFRRAVLFSLSRTNPVGHGPLRSDYLNPIFRYGQ